MTQDAADEMKTRLRADLRTAMKAGRRDEAALIRALVTALDNAEAPPLPEDHRASKQHQFREGSAEIERRRLNRAQVRAILQAEIETREIAAAEMARLGRPDHAAALRAEIGFARGYLGE